MRMKRIQHTPFTCPGRPCSALCDHAETRFDPEHVTRIDRHNFPAIHQGCVDVLCDNGALKHGDGARLVALLPVHEASGFARMEMAVRELAGDDQKWETFFFGEDIEALEIAADSPYLSQLSVILNLWFLVGMPTEGGCDGN